MTHDELLARIFKLSITPETNVVPSELATALMAVVELHSPVKSYMFDDMVCEFCSVIDDHTEIAYPCTTIQTIEQELS